MNAPAILAAIVAVVLVSGVAAVCFAWGVNYGLRSLRWGLHPAIAFDRADAGRRSSPNVRDMRVRRTGDDGNRHDPQVPGVRGNATPPASPEVGPNNP